MSWQTLLYTQQDLQSSLQLHQNRLYYVSSTVPMLPTSVVAGVTSDTEVTLTWVAPVTNGGNAIANYYVEWDTVNSFDSQCGGVDEVQLLTVSAASSAATREAQFCFRGDCTACAALPTDADLATALAGLTTIGDAAAVSVARSGDETVSSRYGFSYTITFDIGAGVPNIQGDLPPVTVTTCGTNPVSYTVSPDVPVYPPPHPPPPPPLPLFLVLYCRASSWCRAVGTAQACATCTPWPPRAPSPSLARPPSPTPSRT